MDFLSAESAGVPPVSGVSDAEPPAEGSGPTSCSPGGDDCLAFPTPPACESDGVPQSGTFAPDVICGPSSSGSSPSNLLASSSVGQGSWPLPLYVSFLPSFEQGAPAPRNAWFSHVFGSPASGDVCAASVGSLPLPDLSLAIASGFHVSLPSAAHSSPSDLTLSGAEIPSHLPVSLSILPECDESSSSSSSPTSTLCHEDISLSGDSDNTVTGVDIHFNPYITEHSQCGKNLSIINTDDTRSVSNPDVSTSSDTLRSDAGLSLSSGICSPVVNDDSSPANACLPACTTCPTPPQEFEESKINQEIPAEAPTTADQCAAAEGADSREEAATHVPETCLDFLKHMWANTPDRDTAQTRSCGAANALIVGIPKTKEQLDASVLLAKTHWVTCYPSLCQPFKIVKQPREEGGLNQQSNLLHMLNNECLQRGRKDCHYGKRDSLPRSTQRRSSPIQSSAEAPQVSYSIVGVPRGERDLKSCCDILNKPNVRVTLSPGMDLFRICMKQKLAAALSSRPEKRENLDNKASNVSPLENEGGKGLLLPGTVSKVDMFFNPATQGPEAPRPQGPAPLPKCRFNFRIVQVPSTPQQYISLSKSKQKKPVEIKPPAPVQDRKGLDFTALNQELMKIQDTSPPVLSPINESLPAASLSLGQQTAVPESISATMQKKQGIPVLKTKARCVANAEVLQSSVPTPSSMATADCLGTLETPSSSTFQTGAALTASRHQLTLPLSFTENLKQDKFAEQSRISELPGADCREKYTDTEHIEVSEVVSGAVGSDRKTSQTKTASAWTKVGRFTFQRAQDTTANTQEDDDSDCTQAAEAASSTSPVLEASGNAAEDVSPQADKGSCEWTYGWAKRKAIRPQDIVR